MLVDLVARHVNAKPLDEAEMRYLCSGVLGCFVGTRTVYTVISLGITGESFGTPAAITVASAATCTVFGTAICQACAISTGSEVPWMCRWF